MSEDDKQRLLEFKAMMVDAIRRTKKTGKEHGFSVCEEDKKLVVSDMCEGTKCEVRLKKCSWPHTFMEFHTHPPGSMIIPSIEDVIGYLAEHVGYACMGTTFDGGTVRCYKINHDDPAVKEFVQAWHDYNWNNDLSRRSDMIGILAGSTASKNKLLEEAAEWKKVL